MTKDQKAINEAYKLGINHTERSSEPYAYAPKEYSTVRNENGEEDALKKNIALELNNMTKRAARGLKEDYLYIITNMNKLHKDLSSIINKV